jgi:hypothetical protein
MTKTAAILVLALPALMMAGVNRLNPNPDLVADDTRTWCLQRAERPQLATSFGPPQGAVAFAFSSPQLGLTSTPCQASCPTRSACSGSSGWLFALTVAEENTATAKTEPNPAPTAARKNLPAK